MSWRSNTLVINSSLHWPTVRKLHRSRFPRDGTKRATSNKYESRTDFNRYYKLKIVDNPEGTESDADSWEREDVLAARLIERLEENNRCWMNIVIVERSHGRGK